MTNKQRQLQCLYDWIKDRNIKQKPQNEKNISDPDAFSSDSKLRENRR